MPPTPSPTYERLRHYIAKRMRMSHVDQPFDAHGAAENLQLLPHYQQPCENGKLGSATCRADEHQQAKELKG